MVLGNVAGSPLLRGETEAELWLVALLWQSREETHIL